MEIEAIETIYNGYKFRSRLEARWAYFFDLIHIDYEYEPEGFKIGGEYYLPDFYLPYFNLYFEVKRKSLNKQERDEAIRKISYGSHNHHEFAGLICFGDPEDNDLTLYCYEYNDSSAGSAEFKVEFGISDESRDVLIRKYDVRDRETLVDSGGFKRIPTERCDYATVPEFIQKARLKARQVQFDHGMTPDNPRARANKKSDEYQSKRKLK